MNKIKITVNGKTFEAEGNNLFDVLDDFLKDNVSKYVVPEPYDSYEDYLSIGDILYGNCYTQEKFEDLKEKLDNRRKWINEHPNFSLKAVKYNLDERQNTASEISNKLHWMNKGCEAVKAYIKDVTSYIKKNEN